jgi:LysR family glycine cleavage system transcriptional activator
MFHMPSTTALRCLDASARLLSFTKAAQEVHLTQSAVSHHIQALERELGIELFARDRSGLRLTSAGQRYWEDTSTVLHQLQRAAMRAQVKGDGAMPLNIGVASSFANFWLMPRLNDFLGHNQDIVLSLSNRTVSADAILGSDDAVIELCDDATPGVEQREILSLYYQAYGSAALLAQHGIAGAASASPLAHEALAALLGSAALIRTSMAGAWRGWLQGAGLDADVPVQRVVRGPFYAQASMALTAAMNGIGVALLPQYIARNAVDNGQLIRLSEVGWRANRAYCLRWPAHRSSSEALCRFAVWLQGQAQSECPADAAVAGTA